MRRRKFIQTVSASLLSSTMYNSQIQSTALPDIKDPKVGSVEFFEDNTMIQRNLGSFPTKNVFPTTIQVPVKTYKKYNSESKSFVKYSSTLIEDDLIKNIVRQLLPPISVENEVVGLSRLVQREEYKKEYKDSSKLFYTRHPLETLIEARGDCVDKTVLLYSLLANLDYDIGYALLPNHMSVILKKDTITEQFADEYILDKWVSVNGTDYGYIEVVDNNKINNPLDEDDTVDDIYFANTIKDGFEVKNVNAIPTHIKGSVRILLKRLTG